MHIYTGGKTGGHIIPIINMIENDNDYLYIGTKNSLEERISNEKNINFLGIDNYSNKLIYIFKGIKKIKKELINKKIDFVFSTGGFVALPVLLFSLIHKIPIFLFEPNIIIGRTNRIFYPFCKKLFLGYEIKNMKNKMIVSGVPLKIKYEISKIKYDILIIGGSLGSRPLCEIALKLKDKYKVLLIAGKYYKEYYQYFDNIIDYSNNIYSLMNEARVVISRAGAITISELIYINKPFITIPSKNTKDNHQVLNAKYFENLGLCLLFDENEDIRVLFDKLKYIMDSNNYYRIMNKQRNIINNSIDMIREIIKNDVC